MKIYYDLHIHSALSPCGDEDMTPNNIVNMSCLKGLDMIALTDHNSCKNVRATAKAAKGKIKFIPGIEVTTAEEVHVLCYFADIDAAEDMGRLIENKLIKVKNQPEIFGRQLIMSSEDEIVGEEECLLVNACSLDIYSVAEEARKRGGIFVPAHIDRLSYSVISNLGFLPPDLTTDALEITAKNLSAMRGDYKEHYILTSSDAHYLENISERGMFFETTDNMPQKLTEILCNF